MSARRLSHALCIVSLSGCVSGLAPRGSRAAVRVEGSALSPDEAFGAEVELRARGRELRGELLGCDARGVFLALNELGEGRWQKLPWSAVSGLRLRREALGPFAWVWVVLGVLTTSLHGVFAAASAPTWAALGIPSAALGYRPSEPASGCDQVRAWARFPQGVPRAMWPRFGAEPGALAPWQISPSRETLWAPE